MDHGCELFFPLQGPEATGAEIPENGEKLQNSPPRSDPRKWENCPKKGVKLL